MDTKKIAVAADIITNSALELLAAKHGLTVAQVAAAIHAGDVCATEQFATLVKQGVDAALKLSADGMINFN